MQRPAVDDIESQSPTIEGNAEIRRLEDEIPAMDDIESQSPTSDKRDEINAEIQLLKNETSGVVEMSQSPTIDKRDEIQLLEDETSGVVEMYAKKTTVQNILLSSCVAGDGGILAAVWSGQKMKDLLGCASAKSTLTLSGLVSTAFICAFVYVFLVQFRLFKSAKQLQQDRDSTAKRRFCGTYSKKVFASTSATWWLPRAVFLTVLIAISACLLLSVARLLCWYLLAPLLIICWFLLLGFSI